MRGRAALSSLMLEITPAGVSKGSFATSLAAVLVWRDDSTHQQPLEAVWTVAARGHSDPHRCAALIFSCSVSLRLAREFGWQSSQYYSNNNNNTLSSSVSFPRHPFLPNYQELYAKIETAALIYVHMLMERSKCGIIAPETQRRPPFDCATCPVSSFMLTHCCNTITDIFQFFITIFSEYFFSVMATVIAF